MAHSENIPVLRHLLLSHPEVPLHHLRRRMHNQAGSPQRIPDCSRWSRYLSGYLQNLYKRCGEIFCQWYDKIPDHRIRPVHWYYLPPVIPGKEGHKQTVHNAYRSHQILKRRKYNNHDSFVRNRSFPDYHNLQRHPSDGWFHLPQVLRILPRHWQYRPVGRQVSGCWA